MESTDRRSMTSRVLWSLIIAATLLTVAGGIGEYGELKKDKAETDSWLARGAPNGVLSLSERAPWISRILTAALYVGGASCLLALVCLVTGPNRSRVLAALLLSLIAMGFARYFRDGESYRTVQVVNVQRQ